MDFSVVIPWRGTGDDWRDRSWQWTRERWRRLYPQAELCVGSNGDEPFSRSKARNEAAAKASTDLFVIADADTPPLQDFLDEALEIAASTRRWVIPYATGRYYNLRRDTTEALLDQDFDCPIGEPIEYEHAVTAVAGLLVVPREAFQSVGGYDERFIGWGYEDNDFSMALDALHGPHVRVNGYVVHLWHPVGPNDAFNQPNIVHNRKLHQQYEHARGNPVKMRRVLAQ